MAKAATRETSPDTKAVVAEAKATTATSKKTTAKAKAAKPKAANGRTTCGKKAMNPVSNPVPAAGNHLRLAEKSIISTTARKNDGTLSPERLNNEITRSSHLPRRFPAMNPSATPPTRPTSAEHAANARVLPQAWASRSATGRCRYGE